jgi:16S rRNA G527 N7-methylase RsmG
MAIDATGKKARFLQDAAESLGLENLRVRHARGSDLAREGGFQFDVVLLRAVTKLDQGLTEAAPLVRQGSSVVFYKTPHIEPGELDSAERVASQLGFQHGTHFDLMLPSEDGLIARRLIRYMKS